MHHRAQSPQSITLTTKKRSAQGSIQRLHFSFSFWGCIELIERNLSPGRVSYFLIKTKRTPLEALGTNLYACLWNTVNRTPPKSPKSTDGSWKDKQERKMMFWIAHLVDTTPWADFVVIGDQLWFIITKLLHYCIFRLNWMTEGFFLDCYLYLTICRSTISCFWMWWRSRRRTRRLLLLSSAGTCLRDTWRN